MATVLDIRHETLAGFLHWEQQQPERYERVGGVVRMMTGGTAAHNRIVQCLAAALAQRIGGTGCEVFTSDMKVVSPDDDVMYPDVVVVCGQVPDSASRLDAPVVVIEVLSDSTAVRDHGTKRWAYQTIPSLQHYLLVDQAQPVVDVFSRGDDGTWRSVVVRGTDQRLRLPALSIEIGLDEVFQRVTFGASGEAAEAAPSE